MKKLIITGILTIAAFSLNAVPLTWELLDADKDGSGTKAEWAEAQKVANPKATDKARANWFKNWDKDKDGSISMAEFDTKKAANRAAQKAKAAARNKGQQGDAMGKKKGKKK